MPTLPTNRSTASTAAEHVSDHNTLHGFNNTHDTDAAAHTGTFVRLVGGTASRLTGNFYLSNTGTIYGRNVANTADIQVIGTTNGDDIVVGGNNGQDLFIYVGGPLNPDIVLDSTLGGGVGVVTTASGMRVGAIVGGALTEKLVVVGNASIEPGAVSSYLRFLATGTGAKNWRAGTGFITAGRFEIQDTSDSASAYLSIDPTGNVRLGQVYSTSTVAATQLLVGTGTDNATTKFLVNSSGQPRWVEATNITTTVGAAGAAAALPANPAKYLTVLDAAGNPFKIPAYNP